MSRNWDLCAVFGVFVKEILQKPEFSESEKAKNALPDHPGLTVFGYLTDKNEFFFEFSFLGRNDSTRKKIMSIAL